MDYDCIDGWHDRLTLSLRGCISDCVKSKMLAANPEYVEDAQELLFGLADRDTVIDTTLSWLRSSQILAYHGSRLIDSEVDAIRIDGLIPLEACARRTRLDRALSKHARWDEVENRLDETIRACGPGMRVGGRENQTHLTLSRSGLTGSFNHYLTYGAEFDQHVAKILLGREGMDLLACDGSPTLIRFAVPGACALAAAHPHFRIEDLRDRGDVPNIVSQFLMVWSYRLAHPGFQTRELRTDCGMVFSSAVPAAWIENVETL